MSCLRSTEAAAKARFLIAQTGSTPPELRARRGDFPDWSVLARACAAQVDVLRADLGERPARARAHAGVIVTVNGDGQRTPVLERGHRRLAARSRRRRCPLLGVCSGHQLIAHALGGHVDYDPGGREIGTGRIECATNAREDPLMSGTPRVLRRTCRTSKASFNCRAARRSSRDPRTTRTTLCVTPRWRGLQFHPEFSVEIMRGYLRRSIYAPNRDCPADCHTGRAHAPAPQARRLLRRFRQVALGLRSTADAAVAVSGRARAP